MFVMLKEELLKQILGQWNADMSDSNLCVIGQKITSPELSLYVVFDVGGPEGWVEESERVWNWLLIDLVGGEKEKSITY